MRHRTLATAMTAVVLLLAACGNTVEQSQSPTGTPRASVPGDPSVLPTIVSSELVANRPQRVLFSFLDSSGASPVASPDRTASVVFRGPGGTIEAPDGTFIWAIEDVSGLYVTTATFPAAGDWVAEFTTQLNDAAPETIPFGFQVKADSSVLQVGEAAPSVETPTIGSAGNVAAISTDEEPVERFYETSVADALAAGEPFVVVFATPKFCQQAVCGPTLERVKTVAAQHPDMTVINVEPYRLEAIDGQLQPVDGQLTTVPAADAFGLISEPFVFVVGADGTIGASFELIFADDELEIAIDAALERA